MPFLDSKAPKGVKSLKMEWTEKGPLLTWKAPKAKKKKWGDVANRFAIYRFEKGAPVNLNDVTALQAVVYDTTYPIPYVKDQKYTYVVTALDRVVMRVRLRRKPFRFRRSGFSCFFHSDSERFFLLKAWNCTFIHKKTLKRFSISNFICTFAESFQRSICFLMQH